jgi:hypothetical protein
VGASTSFRMFLLSLDSWHVEHRNSQRNLARCLPIILALQSFYAIQHAILSCWLTVLILITCMKYPLAQFISLLFTFYFRPVVVTKKREVFKRTYRVVSKCCKGWTGPECTQRKLTLGIQSLQNKTVAWWVMVNFIEIQCQ